MTNVKFDLTGKYQPSTHETVWLYVLIPRWKSRCIYEADDMKCIVFEVHFLFLTNYYKTLFSTLCYLF